MREKLWRNPEFLYAVTIARVDLREASEDNIGIHQEAEATEGDDEDDSDFPDDDDTGRDHHEAIHNYQFLSGIMYMNPLQILQDHQGRLSL